jgi:phosphoglycerate dehydrogenase-like enzyme
MRQPDARSSTVLDSGLSKTPTATIAPTRSGAIEKSRQKVLITTPLEPEQVESLRLRHPDFEIVYPEELLAIPRYAGHHVAAPTDSPERLLAWRELLAGTDILFDFGPSALHAELTGLPRLKWIQATSSGVGQFARRVGLTERSDLIVTTASGVHGAALAEFVVMSMIYFNRGFGGVIRDQRAHHWQRGAGRLIAGQTVGIVGLGSVGGATARYVCALGARVIGVVRSLAGRTAADCGVARLVAQQDLDQVLPELDVLVLAVPHTAETEGLLSARRIGLLAPTCLFVNIARGSVVDEPALVAALQAGRIKGAALDVFAEEPLPPTSPLWDLPNVLVSPHSASTVEGENEKIVDLFSANLLRYRAGEPLLNVLNSELLY